MKKILEMLEIGIEKVQSEATTYHLLYDMQLREIEALKQKLAEKDATISDADALIAKYEEDMSVYTADIMKLNQQIHEREYLKHIEEVSSRGE